MGKGEKLRLIEGNEACAEGAIAAGMRFFAGYPITPSTEIAEHLSRRLPQVGGIFIQMEDEIGSLAAVIGASLAGMKAMTATSGPGFSLMQEHMGFAVMAEVPCVIVNVQRVGPSTGRPTSPAQGDLMQTRWGTHGEHAVVALAPFSVEECFYLTVKAFNISEMLRTPVVVLSDAIIGHMREVMRIPDPEELEIVERKKPTCPPEEYLPFKADDDDLVPPLPAFGDGYRFHITGLTHDERGFPTNDPDVTHALTTRLVEKVRRRRDELVDYESYDLDDAEIVVFAYGSTGRAARWAVREARKRGIKAGLFRPRTLWPFPDKEIREVAERAGAVLVVEMNTGQALHSVIEAVRGKAEVKFFGEVRGEIIHPQKILDCITGFSRLPEAA